MDMMWKGLCAVVILSSIYEVAESQRIQPNKENLKKVPLDYEVFAFKPSNSSGLRWSHIEGEFTSTENYYSAYYSIFNPNFLSFYPATRDGCVELITTSQSSTDFNCDYAVNGGFFTWDITVTGSLCKGNLISDSVAWQLPTDGR